MHGHWVVPGGITAAMAAPRLPLVISLHGSDVFVAERLAPARLAARAAFRRAGCVTACSADLAAPRDRDWGGSRAHRTSCPYGVDAARFSPAPSARRHERDRLGVPSTRS